MIKNKWSILNQSPRTTTLIAVLVAVLVLGVALLLRQRLSSSSSLASCYGYSCQPRVTLTARAIGSDGPFVTGSLMAPRSSKIELTWSAANVKRCTATPAWTDDGGSYSPPTTYLPIITRNKKFTVNCAPVSKGAPPVSSSVNVMVQ